MKKIKDTIASFLYKLVILLVRVTPSSSGQKHLLIVKLDEIGDYILFRDQLKYFRSAEKYRGYKITLLGNQAWKAIFDEYDKESVDECIWITKKQFNKDLKYRFGIFLKVRKAQISDLVNCVFSRSFDLEDGAVFVSKAKNKIAMVGDNSNSGKFSINIDRFIYTELVDAGDKKMFDTTRNCLFLQKVLSIHTIPTSSRFPVIPSAGEPIAEHIVIFIGAGNVERRWPIEHFAKLCDYVWDKYGIATFVTGGPPDTENGEKFMSLYKGKAVNYVGKTTLPQLIGLMATARLTVSVDTGPMHIALAAGSPVIGLFSGKYYKRYAPYPESMNVQLLNLYPDHIDALIKTDDPVLYDPFKTLNDTIYMIGVEKVQTAADKVLG